jgi:hypothetical protein
MKETIRVKDFGRMIRIKYKDAETKEPRLWEANPQTLLQNCQRITAYYMKRSIKLTLRQLYYQLVSEGLIPNAIEIYGRIGDFVTDARYAGLLDWDAIEDRARAQMQRQDWTDVEDRIESAVYSYRLPRWDDQDEYIELFTEKDALVSVLRPITDRWHIRLCVNKGYASASVMYELAKRLAEKIKEGKRVTCLYVGDHDASGLDMVRDVRERVTEFLEKGKTYVVPEFTIEPVALTDEQVRLYKPPPNPAKISDPRAAWYIQKYGRSSWEVDALKPDVMIQIVEDAVIAHVDVDKYNAVIAKEEKDKDVIRAFLKSDECRALVEETKEWKAAQVTPYKLDKDDLRTKAFIMSEMRTFTYDDKEAAKDADRDVGDVDYFCPVCDQYYLSPDEMYDHLWEDHSKESIKELFDGEEVEE